MMKKIAGIGLVVALVVALVGGTAYILLRPKSQGRVEAWPRLRGYWGGEAECEWGQQGTDGRGGWGHRHGSLYRQEVPSSDSLGSYRPFRLSVR